MPKQYDPITLEIIQNSLQAAADEMFAALRRTAMSAIIYEVLDMGTGITDRNGELAGSGAGIPAFVGVLDKSVKNIINKFSRPGAIEPGDVFMTNDPYHGGVTHLNDMILLMKVLLRHGSVFHPKYPAAMGIYYEIGMRLHDLIMRCLAEHMPDRVPAGGFASICGTLFGGTHPDTGRPYAVIEPEIGGWGGSSIRDGMPCQFSPFHGETYNCPAEVAEARYGVTVDYLSFHDEDGGAGLHRGGKGVCIDYRIRSDNAWLTLAYTRDKFPPWPLKGGQPGSPNHVVIRRANGPQGGPGACFHITLPVEAAPIKPHHATSESDPLRSRSELRVVGLAAGQPHRRLLIVDDKVNNRELLVQLFAPLDFELHQAENGRQAVEIWQKLQPNLILIDMQMPLLDGYETTRQIRKAESDRLKGAEREPNLASSIRTVIIALTASSFVQDKAKILAAGCDDFLSKPFVEADLFEMIRRHLGVTFIYQGDAPAPPRPVPSGLYALSSLQTALPDLILLDIMMPEMDGYEVCRRLKANEQSRNIPVIFISALDDAFDKVKAFTAGGVDYISKPFQAEEVLARVETHLALRRMQLELRDKNEALTEANLTLEDKVAARTRALAEANASLQAEIEQRQRHQQKKDHLFDLAQQQSEQLRLMTHSLLESQQDQRQGLSTGLSQQIQQKITHIRANMATLQSLLPLSPDARLLAAINDTLRLLTEMDTYLQDVTSGLDNSEASQLTLRDDLLLKLSARERQMPGCWPPSKAPLTLPTS